MKDLARLILMGEFMTDYSKFSSFDVSMKDALFAQILTVLNKEEFVKLVRLDMKLRMESIVFPYLWLSLVQVI